MKTGDVVLATSWHKISYVMLINKCTKIKFKCNISQVIMKKKMLFLVTLKKYFSLVYSKSSKRIINGFINEL